MMKVTAVAVGLSVALAAEEVCRERRAEASKLGCPATAQNMCECRGYPAASFKPETVVAPEGSRVTADGRHAEGSCGFADATCDLKWAVVCCDAGDLGASDLAAGDLLERKLQTSIDFETAEEFCERNGFDDPNYDSSRIAYPGMGFVGSTGYMSGTCGNVVAESDDQWATCCCQDASYCCPQGEDSDDCLAKEDLLDLAPVPMMMMGSYSYSYSYVEDVDVPDLPDYTPDAPDVPSPADGCPVMDGLDTSVCLEHGMKDDDCCAAVAAMGCETGFAPTVGDACGMMDSESAADDMHYTTCCYPKCPDSASWHKNGEPSKDCAWVADHPPRCNVKGADRVLASYACPGACDTPCVDSLTWYKNGEPAKTCGWVSTFTKRCSVVGHDGTLASYSCPTACDGEDEAATPDSDVWYKNGEPSKTCAWVSQVPDPRCGVKGWDLTFGWYSCPVACGVDSTLADDDMWFKNGEPAKTCAWVSLFAEARCTVNGWNGVVASEACPLACSQL